MVVADSDLIIDYLRNADPGASVVDGWFRQDRLRLTVITAFELRVGDDYERRERQIQTLLHRRTLGFGRLAALEAGRVSRELRGRGRGIGQLDCMQAGICLRFNLPLATRNVRHFERVEGLRLVSLDD